MKTWFVTTAIAAALLAASLAGCAPAPTTTSTAVTPTAAAVQTTTLNTEQAAFDFICPTLESGALDVGVTAFNADVQTGYAKAVLMCKVGVITTPGQFAADFIIIEPVIAAQLKGVKISF